MRRGKFGAVRLRGEQAVPAGYGQSGLGGVEAIGTQAGEARVLSARVEDTAAAGAEVGAIGAGGSLKHLLLGGAKLEGAAHAQLEVVCGGGVGTSLVAQAPTVQQLLHTHQEAACELYLFQCALDVRGWRPV